MELATPITVYWDLPFCLNDIDFLKRICNDIIQLRPLMLQLNADDFSSDDTFRTLLETFNGSPIAVSLTVPAASLSHSGWSILADVKLKELLFESESASELPGLADGFRSVTANSPSGAIPGLSIVTTRDNWRSLPSIVDFCRAHDLRRLVLPMQRLYKNEMPFLLSKTEQMELQQALATVGSIEDINLTIHDPFLWKAFNPGTPFPQAGCQAANTMIAISDDGGVYPCPSLPVKLGTIGDTTLKEIVASSLKKGFRRKLMDAPADCSECPEVTECGGGCRGRAFVQHGSLDGIDSACR